MKDVGSMFGVSDTWRSTFEEAHAGILVMRGVVNPPQHAALEQWKAALEEQLRSQYLGRDRAAVGNHPILQAYAAYYRRFKKTYHVQLQLESIALWILSENEPSLDKFCNT